MHAFSDIMMIFDFAVLVARLSFAFFSFGTEMRLTLRMAACRHHLFVRFPIMSCILVVLFGHH